MMGGVEMQIDRCALHGNSVAVVCLHLCASVMEESSLESLAGRVCNSGKCSSSCTSWRETGTHGSSCARLPHNLASACY